MGLDIANNGGHALAAFQDFVTLTSRLYAPARARTAPAQSIPLSPLTTRRRGRRSRRGGHCESAHEFGAGLHVNLLLPLDSKGLIFDTEHIRAPGGLVDQLHQPHHVRGFQGVEIDLPRHPGSARRPPRTSG